MIAAVTACIEQVEEIRSHHSEELLDLIESLDDTLIEPAISGGKCPAHILAQLSEARGRLAAVRDALTPAINFTLEALADAEWEATPDTTDAPPSKGEEESE